MAKAGFWLRGAKGKLAGAVAQKGEKGTVLRENVIPANPRTAAQMTHRVIFGTVTSAAKHMLPIIGQSFEGVPNFKENRREFIKLNINELIKQNQDDETKPNCSVKGVSTIIANDYIISRGSLDYGMYVETSDKQNSFAIISGEGLDAGSYDEKQFFKTMFDLEAGDQVTAVFLMAVPQYIYGPVAGYRDSIPEIKMFAKRCVLNATLAENTYTLAAGGTPATTYQSDIYANINYDKSDKDFAELLLKINDGLNADEKLSPYNLTWSMLGNLATEGLYEELIGVAFFKSKFDGEWKYSNAQIKCLDSDGGGDSGLVVTLGVPPQTAILSYYQKYSSSDWFTRQGGDINSI